TPEIVLLFIVISLNCVCYRCQLRSRVECTLVRRHMHRQQAGNCEPVFPMHWKAFHWQAGSRFGPPCYVGSRGFSFWFPVREVWGAGFLAGRLVSGGSVRI